VPNNHPYATAIKWAASKGITKGFPDGTFGINRACTRGEAMQFLWRTAGCPQPKTAANSPFKDVPKTHAFYKAILWGSQKGITKGYSDGTFGINRTCTRGQICTFVWRFKGKPKSTLTKNPFKDSIYPSYRNAVLWAAGKKVTVGFSDGTFRDSAACTRGMIVAFIYRATVLI
jgi:hypothetical protein